MAQQPISLQSPVGESEETNFGDFIEDKGAENPSDMTAIVLLKEKIKDVLETLTVRERQVLEHGRDHAKGRRREVDPRPDHGPVPHHVERIGARDPALEQPIGGGDALPNVDEVVGARAALGTNRTHMAAGAVRAAAAAYLAGELGGDIHPRAIAKLPNHRFVSTVKVGSVNSGAFVVGSVRPEDVFERRIPAGDLAAHEALRAAVEARTGALRRRVVAAELESLDGRILAALGVSDAPAAELAAATVDRAELPEDRKAAAQELVLGRGMSYAAAGRVLGVSVATIRRDIGRLDARGQTPRPHVLPDPEAGTA